MLDGCGREIDHLRLSLLDYCNLACRYCVPEGLKVPVRMIDARFAFEVATWLAGAHGIDHLRLTGGEPLLYPDLVPLIERLQASGLLKELTLTTNGQGLRVRAADLKSAGLTRINVSLDTLDPEKFREETRGGDIRHTLEGIEEACDVGLSPVRINVVAQRGVNEDELVELARWGIQRGCVVRFLEVMPIGPLAHAVDKHLVSARQILDRLGERFTLTPTSGYLGQPADDYRIEGEGLVGTVGVIAPTTRSFCDRCRRMRLTSHGALVPCLHENRQYDLMPFWDGQSLDLDSADRLLQEAVMQKPAEGSKSQSLTMLSLGG